MATYDWILFSDLTHEKTIPVSDNNYQRPLRSLVAFLKRRNLSWLLTANVVVVDGKNCLRVTRQQ